MQKFDQKALRFLRRLTGETTAEFRPDQLKVIRGLVTQHQRILLVQRTGWGKSAVYFIATRMLREQGSGPTLLVSPLLALMRNQIEAAARMGIRVFTINSSNRPEWDRAEAQLSRDAVDILLISPERLANQRFRSDVLPGIVRKTGLLVIDEAHCISDWGHDFRPDYRRITRVLDFLGGAPVLCCTATANDRVIQDLTAQLGSGLSTVRGTLARPGLRLHVLEMPLQADRLVWLADTVGKLGGTGVIYCLTIRDVQKVAEWLQSVGIQAVPYWGGMASEERIEAEQALLSNQVNVVVATTALGMGFDKPDLSFVIHYQSPGSPIAYYQQVGRAGRALDESWGILMRGREDPDIQDHFIYSAFPPAHLAERVVELLETRAEPMSTDEICQSVNVRWSQLAKLLKDLEVEGAVEKDGSRWHRTLRRWKFDRDRVQAVTAQRRLEQEQMLDYIRTKVCRMQRLGSYLDDATPEPCEVCDNCTGRSFVFPFDPAVSQRAVDFLRKVDRTIEPRRQLPDRRAIPKGQLLERGRAMSVWGDGGWGTLVRTGKQQEGRFRDQLVKASARLISRSWAPNPAPTWIAAVPSLRNPELVQDFVARLATSLGLIYKNVIVKVRDTEPQKNMQNSHQQYGNVRGAFRIVGAVSHGPVLLVDDVVDSRWTLTIVGRELRLAGSGPVYPFALADTAGRLVT